MAKSLLIPLVTLCGCAVVNSAPPPEQVRQLRDARDACLARNVVALDDYRSDAATIGMAVVAACRYENAALVQAIAGPDGFRQGEISRADRAKQPGRRDPGGRHAPGAAAVVTGRLSERQGGGQ